MAMSQSERSTKYKKEKNISRYELNMTPEELKIIETVEGITHTNRKQAILTACREYAAAHKIAPTPRADEGKDEGNGK